MRESSISRDELACNGVRLVKDHQLYAALCGAADTIRSIARQLSNSCSDSAYSIAEADLLLDISTEVDKGMKQIEKWREL